MERAILYFDPQDNPETNICDALHSAFGNDCPSPLRFKGQRETVEVQYDVSQITGIDHRITNGNRILSFAGVICEKETVSKRYFAANLNEQKNEEPHPVTFHIFSNEEL